VHEGDEPQVLVHLPHPYRLSGKHLTEIDLVLSGIRDYGLAHVDTEVVPMRAPRRYMK